MPRKRLKKGDITVKEILDLSKDLYKKKDIDNKARRVKLDITGAKITVRKNMIYDKNSKNWEQSGQLIKIIVMVTSKPVSYNRIDTLKLHRYPVFFLIQNLDKGIESPFRWRTGSFKKPRFTGSKSTKKERERVANQNIRNMVQMQFIFDLIQVLDKFDLLYGPNTSNRKNPSKTNPKLDPFFDKHALYAVEKIVIPLLTKGKKKLKKQLKL